MITEASSAPSVCVSVVVFRSDPDRLRAALTCLAASLSKACADGLLRGGTVVVCDNDSGSDYRGRLAVLVDELTGHYQAPLALRMLESAENLGYGGGVNRALVASDDTYLLVLNPDVELAAEAVSAGLRSLQASPSCVAVAPRCQRPGGEAERLCKRYPAVFDLLLRGADVGVLRSLFRGRLARYDYGDCDPAQAMEVELLSGACMLLRGDAFRAVGGFDPGFFMYFEDFDLSLRLRSHGALCYEPAMRAVHHGGFAAAKGSRHIRWFAASARRFYRRHGWRWI